MTYVIENEPGASDRIDVDLAGLTVNDSMSVQESV